MRSVVTVFLIASLVACATAPTPGQRNTGISSSLALCPGAGISNAPQTDRNRRIIGYSPQTRIGGTTLYRAPVNACVSSGFGPRRGGASSFHSGVDLFTRNPAPVYAGGDGVVETMKSMRGYGKTIVIGHGSDLKTRYAHLSRYASGIRPGDRVTRGDYIGHTGETGNATAVHLHYEIIAGGRARNPLTVGR